ncbi:HAMP domain-containing protein [Sphingobium fluviale]|uniref:histidine kinase n=2 Tax=Sphingobium fluviale TaxID=2506423 RepID=A0A4Q1KLM5_9SPHN|nr:HAMP domain-containing protein [Sphingobium fluviale]
MCSPKATMVRRLIHRNIALLVGVVLAGQLLAGLLVMALVVQPQTARVASVTADMIEALSSAMDGLPPARRAALIAQINRRGAMAIRRAHDVPGDGPRFPSFIERQFTRALADRLATQRDLVWRTDAGRRLWVSLTLGGQDYWVSVTPPRSRGAMTSLLMASFIAFLVSAVGGLLLQRRLDQPLRRLAAAVDGYTPEQAHAPLDTSGPQEVAAVATAFNRMTERLAAHEAERAVMLGGVSHDLRTPLTRLRLCLEMMRGGDAELEATALRQVERIEAMLGQFLDFARGFEAEEFQRCDIAALLEQVVADHAALPPVALAAAPGLTAKVRPLALSRAVGNLLANALRHGAAPVRVEARMDDKSLIIAVTDAGAGFEAVSSGDLMRPFARGDAARGGDGTGLGLAIVERAVTAQGGHVAFARTAGGFEACITINCA